MIERYCWSEDGERFEGDDHATREGAIQAAIEEITDREGEQPTSIWTGKSRRLSMGSLMGRRIAYTVQDEAPDAAGDECGEAAESWNPKVSTEAVAEFTKFLDEWATKHDLQPTCWAVEEIQEHAVNRSGDTGT